MTREEAIDELLGNEAQVAQEFCIGRAERDASRRDAVEALKALGVTEEEIRAAGWSIPGPLTAEQGRRS